MGTVGGGDDLRLAPSALGIGGLLTDAGEEHSCPEQEAE